LADPAWHAPAAGFGDQEFYPDLFDKAAVLACRLARNHPLPDGNKRATRAGLRMFIDFNGGRGDPDPPPSMRPRQSCWRRPPGTGTRRRWRRGCANASASP